MGKKSQVYSFAIMVKAQHKCSSAILGTCEIQPSNSIREREIEGPNSPTGVCCDVDGSMAVADSGHRHVQIWMPLVASFLHFLEVQELGQRRSINRLTCVICLLLLLHHQLQHLSSW